MAEINNLPPASIEAEEAILGGILFDPEAITRVAELVVKDAFYVKAHQEIYFAALSLNAKGQPTDFISVSTYLSDRDLLEQVGGTTKLAQLLNRTVSAVNVDRYANLIMEKYVRRQLITSGHEIVDLGYDNTSELEVVLDAAEQKIFRLTQERPQEGLVPIAETLVNTFNTIEELHQETALPGIPSGYYDLDAMTSGFSRSDLIIIAGRPSMGKCLAADSQLVCQDGSVRTIEEIYHRQQDSLLTLEANGKFSWTEPSAFIDDGIKPVYQVTTRLGRQIKTTLTHPFLTIQGWQSLAGLQVGNKIAVPRQINVFGNNVIAESKVKLLAYLIGDGCLTKTCPEFTNSNPSLRQDFADAVASFIGLTTQESDCRGTRTVSIRVSKDQAFVARHRQIFAQKLKQAIANQSFTLNQIASFLNVNPGLVRFWLKGACVPQQQTFEQLCSLLKVESENLTPHGILAIAKSSPNALTLWLKELNLWSKNAHEKTIPSLLFSLQPHLIALFLNRLFATDGWATVLASGQSQLGYATVSETLARQLQHLLLRFSVIATLKERFVKYQQKRRIVWQLDITDAQSIKNFLDAIGIFGKEAACDQVREAISKRRYQTNRDLIPVEIWQALAQAKGNQSWRSLAKSAGIKGYSNIHVGKRSLSRERLFKLAYALDHIPLQNLATSEVYWDEIVSIDYLGQQQVYDLTIPRTHNFVANDICVHNTAFSLCVASNIARESRLPIAVFSLEMSREQLTQRLLSSEAKIPSNRLRSGRIAQNEFGQLIDGVERLSELPIYIDDTANLTVMQMRSQVRRLQAQQKDPLGLVMIDYLQLMEGGDNDNRVQQLSKMTRSLKGLARELNVPIVALSQLSRGVEQRTNKRPMLSDLRESGCLSGDSLVTMADTGARIPIKDLVGKSGFRVWALNQTTKKIESALVSNAFATGVKAVFSLQTALGRKIIATANHKFLTIHGWKRLDELNPGDYLAIPRTLFSSDTSTISQAKLALLGHYQQNVSKEIERASRLWTVVNSQDIQDLAKSDLYWDKIVFIRAEGATEVYDLTVPMHHNFVANDIVVHNSIEQDADLVMMIYRDEYYNPDTPDRGITEVSIVKHRNGPVGTIKLLFNPELTRFESLAQPGKY
jgi:replicative DNA helicase